MLRQVLFLSFAILLSHQHESSEDVTELTAESFNEFLQQGKQVITIFFAPWCGHCKRALPEYAGAGSIVKAAGPENMVFGSVDCTKNEEICRDRGVQGYPTIKMFHQDFTCEYKGARTQEAMSDWALNLVQGVTEVTDLDALQTKIKSGYSLVAFVEKEHPLRQLIQSMRCELSSINLSLISDPEMAKKLGISSSNSINVFSDGSFVKTLSKVDSLESIMREVFFVKGPLVPEYTHDTLETIFSPFVSSYVTFIFKTQDHLDQHMPTLKSFAESHAPDVRLFILNASNPSYKDVVEYFKVSKFPEVVYYNDTNQKFHHFNKDEVSVESLGEFARGCKDGSISIYVQRQPIPEGWDQGDVKELVTDTYEKIFEQFKSGVILFYAHWCGHCKAFMPTYEEFAAAISSKYPEIFVAKLDHTQNDILDVSVKGYPTLVFYKSRTDQIYYTGERTVDALLKFVESNLLGVPEAAEPEKEADTVKEDL